MLPLSGKWYRFVRVTKIAIKIIACQVDGRSPRLHVVETLFFVFSRVTKREKKKCVYFSIRTDNRNVERVFFLSTFALIVLVFYPEQSVDNAFVIERHIFNLWRDGDGDNAFLKMFSLREDVQSSLKCISQNVKEQRTNTIK